jgi:hypothetical protein
MGGFGRLGSSGAVLAVGSRGARRTNSASGQRLATGLALVGLCVGLSACSDGSPVTVTNSGSGASSAPGIQYKQLPVEYPGLRATGTIEYLDVSQMSNSALESTINRNILKVVNGIKADFLGLVAKADGLSSSAAAQAEVTTTTTKGATTSSLPAATSTITIGDDLEGNSTSWLSFQLHGTFDIVGSASPVNVVRTITVSMHDGSVVTLDQLFKPGVDYLNLLSRLAEPQVLAAVENLAGNVPAATLESLTQAATAPVAANFAAWNLTTGGLEFSIGAASFPASIGPQSVTIPYSQLAEDAAPSGFIPTS